MTRVGGYLFYINLLPNTLALTILLEYYKPIIFILFIYTLAESRYVNTKKEVLAIIKYLLEYR